jgi:hypothetical protein
MGSSPPLHFRTGFLLCAVELARVLAVEEVQQLVEVAIVVILFNRSNVLGHCILPTRRNLFQFLFQIMKNQNRRKNTGGYGTTVACIE